MENLNEQSRTYSFPSRVKWIGQDLVLTSRDFFVILSDLDINIIKEDVIKMGKQALLQNGTLLVHNKDNYVIIEKLNHKGMNRTLMINHTAFVK